MLIKVRPGLVFFFWIATRGKIMKRILLTTTSLVMLAGVASAETSISWSGAATAGVAREGAVVAVATQLTTTMIADLAAEYTVVRNSAAGDSTTAEITGAVLDAAVPATATTLALMASQIATAKIAISNNTNATSANKTLNDAMIAEFDAILAVITAGNAGVVAAKVAGDFATYSEVSTTVKGSVTADNGVTITAAVSVDAGTGYDFADDDGFDAAKTNGVSLDNVTIATAMGTFKIDENAVTHLVDGDDDAAADLLYTNTFGSMSVSVAIDANKDTDEKAVKAVAAVVTDKDATAAAAFSVTADTTVISTAKVTGVAADVAWSAKVSMPVAGGTAYVAMDEEGGNIFGASTTLGGVGLSFSSKLEALEEEISADRSNTLGLSYAMGATTLGASWNSVEDGDQWGISAAYAADGMTISASTDEGSDWSVSGSYALGAGAKVVAGTNYTEDAYLGLSFAF